MVTITGIYTIKMKVLIFDTETTGLLPRSVTSIEQIPYIIQLCYLVYDTITHEIASQNDYIRIPDNVVVSAESQKIHGIAREKLNEEGIDIHESLFNFNQQYKQCDFVVAHNISFDESMINYECVRNTMSPIIHKFDPRKTFYCTMKKSIQICKIEKETKTGRKYFKWPRLTELHAHLFKQTPYKLHNAYHDNLVCLRCFVEMHFGHDLVVVNENFRNEFEPILKE